MSILFVQKKQLLTKFFLGALVATAATQSCSASSHMIEKAPMLRESFKATLSTINNNTKSVPTRTFSLFRSLFNFPRQHPFLTVGAAAIGCGVFAWICYKLLTSPALQSNGGADLIDDVDSLKNLNLNNKQKPVEKKETKQEFIDKMHTVYKKETNKK